MGEDLNQIKKCLRSVLISCPEGTPINKVESDYKSFLGLPLNYRQFGHRNIDTFLLSIPDTARVQGNIVYGVSCAEIKHVTKLINNQRKVTSSVKRVQRARQQPRMLPGPMPNSYRPQSNQHSKFAWGGQNRLGGPIHQHFNPISYGPPLMRTGPLPQRMPPPPPPPPHHYFPHVPPNFPPGPPPPPEDEMIFSDEEIYELLTKENIPNSPPLSHILSLAFPYIYRSAHITILDLNQSLCNQIATAVALDCEQELEGCPAVIVCKMDISQDLALLETSPKVERFRDIASFQKTRVKVITIKFADLFDILNVNNEHFYRQTTFIIFSNVAPSHMNLLSDLLPPELQYLFLSTCCDMKQNSKTLFKEPQIVIAKDGAHYRDFANNGERVIEQLARKLAVLNFRHPPPHPTDSSMPPKGASKPPNKIPQQPFIIPQQPHIMPSQPPPNWPSRLPHCLPTQPHTVPTQPHSLPTQPHSLPTQPHTVPTQPHTVPTQPHTVPTQAHTVPTQPHTVPTQSQGILPTPHQHITQPHTVPTQSQGILPTPHQHVTQSLNIPSQPNSVPSQPNNEPIQPNTVPIQPNTVPTQPNTVPTQPNTVPIQPNTVPTQPNSVPTQPNTVPTQPNNVSSEGQSSPSIVTQPSYPIVTQPPQDSNSIQPQANNMADSDTPEIGAESSDKPDTKGHFPALKHLTESAFKASVNLLIQAEPNKGKTTLLLEFAISKVDTSIDKLQIILTTPSPQTCSALFLRLRELVGLKENTQVRAFGYSEGSLDKLNAYLIEQKVHVLVMDNAHFFSLVSKAPGITAHCKMIGCDELYGSHYTKQVPTSIKYFLEKLSNPNIQFVVMTHPNENEQLIHGLFPKPYWHIRQEEASKKRDKFTVSFLHQ